MPIAGSAPRRWASLVVAGWLTAACGAAGAGGGDALTSRGGADAVRPGTAGPAATLDRDAAPAAPLAVLPPTATAPRTTTAVSPAPGSVAAARPTVPPRRPYRRTGREQFRWSMSAVTAQRLGSSYRAGCPVPVSDLRLLRLTHLGFDGRSHVGELVVHRTHATGIVEVFRRLHAARFPVQRMVTVEQYGSDDDRSMAANNTSAYNCRLTTGGTRWSEHAYGTALDVNPVQNPYVRGSTVEPEAGRAYVDRSRVRPGMVIAGDPVVRAFAAVGWEWGGDFSTLKDYQHFSASGR